MEERGQNKLTAKIIAFIGSSFSKPKFSSLLPLLLSPDTHPLRLTLYRITLSALTSTFGGIVRTSCLAVLKFTTNSTLIGRSTTLVPCRFQRLIHDFDDRFHLDPFRLAGVEILNAVEPAIQVRHVIFGDIVPQGIRRAFAGRRAFLQRDLAFA